MSEIVSTNWLFNNLNKKNLVILDCSFYLPFEKCNAKSEYLNRHIKNSFFFDIDLISDRNNPLPHMLPRADKFEKEINKFGIKSNSIIIVYDTKGIFSSPRVWWMFKYFGHKKVYVLNGGLKKWLKEHKPVTNKKTKFKKGNFKSRILQNWLTDYKYILKNYKKNSIIILDARSNNRYKGLEKEKRVGLKSGHIPNSYNIFWGNLINNKGLLIKKNNIKQIFKKTKNKKIVTSCGSGISACILSLSLLHTMNIESSVYDGSWSEWGSKKGLPINK